MKSSEFAYLLQKIQVMLLADQEREKTGEHHFTIIHGHAKRLVPGGPLVCAPGEIILAVQYGRGEDATSIDFSVKDMLIFDCLARHSEFGQSAGQLVANFAHDPFVRHHGENSGADDAGLLETLSRSGFGTVLGRFRERLKRIVGSDEAVDTILATRTTSTNEVKYKLECSVSWEHRE